MDLKFSHVDENESPRSLVVVRAARGSKGAAAHSGINHRGTF